MVPDAFRKVHTYFKYFARFLFWSTKWVGGGERIPIILRNVKIFNLFFYCSAVDAKFVFFT